jgi:hypothetical protein
MGAKRVAEPSNVATASACDFCTEHDLPHPRATHCPTCHATWTRASNTAHCPTCHRTFSSPGGFDRHLLRVGCRPPDEVKTRAGEPVFEVPPTPNTWGTPVWRRAGKWSGPSSS